MPSKKLSTIVGGGEEFKVSFNSGTLQVASGASGTFITITPPSGERVRLEQMTSFNSSTDISVAVGGLTIISAKTLVSGDPNIGVFSVGHVATNANDSLQVSGNTPPIVSGVDENITVTKNASTTEGDVRYNYSFGVYE